MPDTGVVVGAQGGRSRYATQFPPREVRGTGCKPSFRLKGAPIVQSTRYRSPRVRPAAQGVAPSAPEEPAYSGRGGVDHSASPEFRRERALGTEPRDGGEARRNPRCAAAG